MWSIYKINEIGSCTCGTITNAIAIWCVWFEPKKKKHFYTHLLLATYHSYKRNARNWWMCKRRKGKCENVLSLGEPETRSYSIMIHLPTSTLMPWCFVRCRRFFFFFCRRPPRLLANDFAKHFKILHLSDGIEWSMFEERKKNCRLRISARCQQIGLFSFFFLLEHRLWRPFFAYTN